MEKIAEKEMETLLGAGRILRGEPMSAHTSLRVGGPADYFVRVETLEELKGVLELLHREEEPFFLLGRGSNLLVGDAGYRGCVITMADSSGCAMGAATSGDATKIPLTGIAFEGAGMVAGAGESLAALANAARDHGLSGLEFASGIPGALGGALVMNAGAYGGSMDQLVEEVLLLTPDAQVKTVSSQEMRFGYRHSLLRENSAIALRARLKLTPGEPAVIAGRMRELAALRSQKQPLEYPSAGSTFKRPAGQFAGKLIMDAGLKGFAIGGAQVSEKHCGFVINRDHATAAQIRAVISAVRKRVYEFSGVELEEEIVSLGDFTV